MRKFAVCDKHGCHFTIHAEVVEYEGDMVIFRTHRKSYLQHVALLHAPASVMDATPDVSASS